MDRAEAERIYRPSALEALRAFDLDPDLPRLVAVSENVTFRVVDRRDGAAYVLRLHRPGYHDLASLESERMWLRALADTNIAVPSPVNATDGRDYVPVSVAGTDETRYAGLTRWTEGEIVGDVLRRTDDLRIIHGHFTQLGSIMASMHNQASGWMPPAGFVRHALDAEGFMGDAPFWGRFWEHDALSRTERTILMSGRERIHDVLERYGRSPSTFSMIHADLHHNNVLVDEGALTVIDFDDAGFGWHQYDIAVALHDPQPSSRAAAIERAFVEGYRDIRPLSDDDLALVALFRMVRSLALIGWKQQRPEVEWPSGLFEQIKSDALIRCATFSPPF